MKIVTLVENVSNGALKAVHGLSLYIETKKHKILFDLGPDDTIFKNAEKKNIDIREIDTVIISHGHYDHGGGLKHFLELNNKANVYVQRLAYEPYYAKILMIKKYIGLDKETLEFPNIKLVDGDLIIDEELSLFVSKVEDPIKSEANASLYAENGPDAFRHEQNLLIKENETVLLMGCGHSGVISILESAEERPSRCIGGFHVYNPTTKRTVSKHQLEKLADELARFEDIKFYTCHCTGTEAYRYLHEKQNNINYLSCGTELEI